MSAFCAQKSPKPRLGLGEAGPLLVCTCQSGNCRRDPTGLHSQCWICRHGLGCLSSVISQAVLRAFNQSFMDSSNQPASPAQPSQPAHDEPCPARPLPPYNP